MSISSLHFRDGKWWSDISVAVYTAGTVDLMAYVGFLWQGICAWDGDCSGMWTRAMERRHNAMRKDIVTVSFRSAWQAWWDR